MTNSAEVQLIINAINNASRTIKEVEGDVSKMNKSTAAAKDFLAGMGVSLADFSNPAMMAGRAVGFVTDQVKQSINQFAEYGKQVESVSRKLGISAEEASKLIQVSDDLEVDYSTLTQAMKEGLKDGIVPSIDGLAELAKEYQKITDPTKRAAFAVEKFGKAGLEMQRGAVQRGNALDDGKPQAASSPVAAEHPKETPGQPAALGCFDSRTVVAHRQSYPAGNIPRLDAHPAPRWAVT